MAHMHEWDIIAVKNGWVDGRGYGNNRQKDDGQRSNQGQITWCYVNQEYTNAPSESIKIEEPQKEFQAEVKLEDMKAG